MASVPSSQPFDEPGGEPAAESDQLARPAKRSQTEAQSAEDAAKGALAPPRGGALQSTRRAVWILVFIAIGFTLYLASSLLLPILVAGLLALLLAPAVHRLNALHLPQPASAGIVVVAVLVVIGTLASYLAVPVQRWVEAGPREARRLEQKIATVLRPLQAVKEATDRVAQITDNNGSKKPREVAVERPRLSTYLNLTFTTGVTILATTVLLYFLLASGDLFLRKMVRILPRLRDKIRAIEIAREIQVEIGRYFTTIMLVAIGLGISTSIAMWLLDMPTPVLWGVAVALLNFVPYLGPLIAAVLLAGVALLTFENPVAIVAPPAVYLALNFIEDQLVMPFALGRRLVMSPVIIFLWVLFCTWMWGVGGIVLAVPLLVALRICAERVPTMAPVAELLTRD